MSPSHPTCWVCRQPLPESHPRSHLPHRICDRPVCAETRKRCDHLIERARERTRCTFCDAEPLEGRRVCATHAFKRAPCPGCGGKVPRLDGKGPQRTYCLACRPAKTEKPQ